MNDGMWAGQQVIPSVLGREVNEALVRYGFGTWLRLSCGGSFQAFSVLAGMALRRWGIGGRQCW